jgi:hypothetical protein
MLLPVMPTPGKAEHAIDLGLPPEAAVAVVGRTAEDWGAQFERDPTGGTGGKLHLPVLAGLRKGLVSGEVELWPKGDGSRLVFRPEGAVYFVQTSAVMVLLLATAGGVLTILWPFFPNLLSVAPFGAVIALGGWFLVITRLRTSGPDEFLAAVAAQEEESAPTSANGSANQ